MYGGMIAQHMDYFMFSALYYFIGFVSSHFVGLVGRILAFRILSLMLCGNKIRLSFLV